MRDTRYGSKAAKAQWAPMGEQFEILFNNRTEQRISVRRIDINKSRCALGRRASVSYGPVSLMQSPRCHQSDLDAIEQKANLGAKGQCSACIGQKVQNLTPSYGPVFRAARATASIVQRWRGLGGLFDFMVSWACRVQSIHTER